MDHIKADLRRIEILLQSVDAEIDILISKNQCNPLYRKLSAGALAAVVLLLGLLE